MKFSFVILFSLFTFCAFARYGYAQEKQTPPRSLREIVMMPVVYRVAGMDKVGVKSNLKYTAVDNPNLLMDDVAAAINYVRANADSLNIDKDRICLTAYSAGGALLASAMRDKPGYVRCLVGFYSFMDIRQNGNFFAANETAETLQKFSPLNYLANDSGKIAPLFVARAGLDQIPTMNDSIDRFVRLALAKNAALSFANHPHGVHGFDSQTDDERSREIIQSAITFMKLHLNTAKAAIRITPHQTIRQT